MKNYNSNKIDSLVSFTETDLRVDRPYQSENLSILKYSVPEFIKSDKELMSKVKEIEFNEINNPKKGSFKIFLKKFKK